MPNLNFILNTTNCKYCKFLKDICSHDNAEEHENDFNEIHELFVEDPRSFVKDFGLDERRYFCCIDYEFDEDKFNTLHSRG